MSMSTAPSEAPKSFLDMSDADISAMSMPEPTPQARPAEVVAEAAAPESGDESNDLDTPSTDAETGSEADDEGDSDEESTTREPSAETETSDKAEPDAAPEPTGATDYKAEYDRLLAPFKANGREVSVKNVDDAIALMQMGANYNKKMAALKPNLKLLKLLENNGLLSESKLSYLIDLENKNPAAINKLVKDSGIDPMDLDADKASGYTPKTYTVDDKEMELDSVLEEIQDTPSYRQTLDIVSTKWDGASKQAIVASPQLLKVINGHVQSGIYDTIVKEVDSERVFGRLQGLSDIEAYRQVGDAIQARGGFALLGRQGQQAAGAPVVLSPKPKQPDDGRLRDKKRAASSTKPAAPGGQTGDFSPLSMSDAEFSKSSDKRFL